MISYDTQWTIRYQSNVDHRSVTVTVDSREAAYSTATELLVWMSDCIWIDNPWGDCEMSFLNGQWCDVHSAGEKY